MSVKMQKQDKPQPAASDALKVYPSSNDFAEVVLVAIDPDGNILPLGGMATQNYRLIRVVHLFNGTTTYTPTTGTRALFVECWGGGGSGGGVTGAIGQSSAAGGGGGGGYSCGWLTVNISGAHTVAIGAGGTAPTAGANNGNAGNDTDFKDNAGSTVVLGSGGSGGLSDAANAGIHVGGLGGAGGASSGATGDLKQDGCPGETGAALTTTQVRGGRGGSGARGLAMPVNGVNSGAGIASSGYGSGGGGATSINNATSRAGGAGGNGLMKIREYA